MSIVFVDHAVGSRDLVGPLQFRGLPAELANVEFADLEFVGRGQQGAPVTIGIEVKRLSELTGDWDRFAGEQIPKMVLPVTTPKYDFRWLVREGEWKQDRRGHLLTRGKQGILRPLQGQSSANALTKKLINLEMNGGFHQWATRDRTDTVRFIAALYQYWTDADLDEHKSHIVLYEPHGFAEFSNFRRVAHALPTIGRARSAAAEKFFGGNILLALNSPASDWARIEVVNEEGRVKHIGAKDADKIVRFLRGDS